MGEIKTFKDLIVWQKSMALLTRLYRETNGFPADEKFGLVSQMRRSAVSIPSNIAEGYGRYTPADRKLFYRYARGSFEETKAWLRKLIRRKVIQENEIQKYSTIIDELGPKLNAFIKSTK